MADRVFVIAEAGVNHNGDLGTALRMIDAAREAGADAVKFQTFRAENLVARDAPKAEYQRRTTGGGGQLEMLRKLQLGRDDHFRLAERCREKGIAFMSTPFDLESLALLEEIGVPLHKVASGEVTNLPLLLAIGRTGKPVILSSGMCDLEELRAAVEAVRNAGAGTITVLHCNTEYPTPFKDVNLSAMLTIARELGVRTGYSDHTKGISVPVAAAALGATVIEKHFTLDRNQEGPDHAASLEPRELTDMVRAVREVEEALGDGRKRPSPSEEKNKAIARKSIVARRAIAKGAAIGEDDICAKRPGTGISPMRWFEVVGTAASRDFAEDEMIEL